MVAFKGVAVISGVCHQVAVGEGTLDGGSVEVKAGIVLGEGLSVGPGAGVTDWQAVRIIIVTRHAAAAILFTLSILITLWVSPRRSLL